MTDTITRLWRIDYFQSTGTSSPEFTYGAVGGRIPPMQVRNLTPHVVTLVGPDGSVDLPPDGPPARLVLAPDVPDGEIVVAGFSFPLLRTAATHDIADLPAPQPGVFLLVARPVAEAAPDRDDLVYPHRSVRDDRGVVIGCRALGRPAPVRPPLAHG